MSNFQAISRASCCGNWKIKSLSCTTHVIFHGGEVEHGKQVISCDVKRWVPVATLPEPGDCGWQSSASSRQRQQHNRRTRGEEKNQKLSDVKKICYQPKAELSSSGHGPCSHTRYHCSSLLWKTRLVETMPAGTGSLRLALRFWDAGLHRKCSQNMSIQCLALPHTPMRR